MRIDLGSKSNRNEYHKSMRWFLLFTVLATLFYLYFAVFTTYVLMIDIVFGAMGVVVAAIESVLGLYAYLTFRQMTKI